MHTKGPWTKVDMTIVSAEGEDIALVAYKRSKEDFEANAHLIAAAPELLDIVQRLLTTDHVVTITEILCVVEKARGRLADYT